MTHRAGDITRLILSRITACVLVGLIVTACEKKDVTANENGQHDFRRAGTQESPYEPAYDDPFPGMNERELLKRLADSHEPADLSNILLSLGLKGESAGFQAIVDVVEKRFDGNINESLFDVICTDAVRAISEIAARGHKNAFEYIVSGCSETHWKEINLPWKTALKPEYTHKRLSSAFLHGLARITSKDSYEYSLAVLNSSIETDFDFGLYMTSLYAVQRIVLSWHVGRRGSAQYDHDASSAVAAYLDKSYPDHSICFLTFIQSHE
ncbi:MAG: hypothetical protein M5R36_28900 [Deltaproteobacteria bacterium]|nr:hypothetical protein [Deltaproteobacteria bacterium]